MALTVTNCKNGLTLAGGSVNTWEIFDGTGYTYTFAKTVSNGDFRMFIRARNYSSANDTIEFRCYLFGRKNNTTTTSYNNKADSKVKFTVGDGEVTIKTAKARMPGSGSSVRCLGYGDVTVNIKTSSVGARPMQAIFYGVSGSSDADKTYTVTGPDMNWNKGSVSLASSSVTSSSFTVTASNIVTKRMFLSQWDWAIANSTISGSYGDVKGVTNVGADSTTTSNSESFSSLKAGNKYTVRFRSRFRNYNAFTEVSTGVGVHYSITGSVTTNRLAGTLTMNTDTLSVQYGSTVSKSYSGASGTVSAAVTAGSTYASITSYASNKVTVKGIQAGGTATITVTSAASTLNTSTATNAYAATSKSFKVTVTQAPGSLTVGSSSVELVYGGGAKTVSVGGTGGTVSITNGTPATCTATLSNGVITITPKAVGTSIITVKRAASTNYSAPANQFITVTVSANSGAIKPTVVPNLVYNGKLQKGISGGTNMVVEGTSEATNAGSYTWTATPISGYAWSDDNTTSTITGSWSIAKANDDWTIPSSATVQVGQSTTISVSNKTTTSNNTTSPTDGAYFKSSYSGTTITITGKAEGTANLTVSTAADTNFNARSQTCSVTVSGKPSGYATWSETASTKSLKETQTFAQTVSSTHGGAYSATSSNNDVATVTVSGSTATVTAVGLGTAKITFTVGATTTNTAVTKEIIVTVRPAEVKVGSKTVPVYVGTKPVKRIYKGSTLIL